MDTAACSSSSSRTGGPSAALPVAAHCDQSDADDASYSFDVECWPAELDKERGTLAS